MRPVTFTDRANVLLRNYGYRFCGHILIENAIRGFSSERIVGRFSSYPAALDYLVPIVHEEGFTDRYIAIGKM